MVAFFPSTTIGVVSEYIGNLNLGADRCHGLLNVLLHVALQLFHVCCANMCNPNVSVLSKKINLG